MSRDTMLTKLMAVGASDKANGSIEGFGIAKSILFFAQHSYEIRSGSTRLWGQGGEFEMEEIAESESASAGFSI